MKLIDWLYRWRERRRLTKVVRRLLSEGGSELAEAKARAIQAAIAERRPVCRTCLNPYIPKDHEFAEWVRLRSILGIPDRHPNPMICESCFETALAAFNPQYTNVGTSNCGPPNLALRRFGSNEFNGSSS